MTLTLVYDGDCPFCSAFAQRAELTGGLPELDIRDGRTDHTLRAELASRGYRLANGAMLIEQGRIWHGSAAIAELHRRMQPSDALLQVLQGLFKQDDRARRMYPLMLLARRIALAVKGCPVDPDEIRQ